MSDTKKILKNIRNLIESEKYEEALPICRNLRADNPGNIMCLLFLSKCLMAQNIKNDEIYTCLTEAKYIDPSNINVQKGIKGFLDQNIEKYTDEFADFYNNLIISEIISDEEVKFIESKLYDIKVVSNINIRTFISTYINFIINKNEKLEACNILKKLALMDFTLNKGSFFWLEKFRETLDICKNDLNSGNLKKFEVLLNIFDCVSNEDYSIETVVDLMNDNGLYDLHMGIYLAKLSNEQYSTEEAKNYLLKTDNDFKNSIDESYKQQMECVYLNILILERNVEDADELIEEIEPNSISVYTWNLLYQMGCKVDENRRGFSSEMNDKEHFISKMILLQSINEEINRDFLNLKENLSKSLTSFEWYILGCIMKRLNVDRYLLICYENGINQCKYIYSGNFLELARHYQQNQLDIDRSIGYYLDYLKYNFKYDIFEELFDVFIQNDNLANAIYLMKNFEKLDYDNCSSDLLRKFVKCILSYNNLYKSVNECNDESNMDLAVVLAQRLVKAQSDDESTWILLGDTYGVRGNLTSAFKCYDRANNMRQGGNCNALLRMASIYALIFESKKEVENYTRSREFFQLALDKEVNKEYLQKLCELIYIYGEMCFNKMALRSSCDAFQEIIDLIANYKDCIEDDEEFMLLLGRVMVMSILNRFDHLLNFDFIKDKVELKPFVKYSSTEIAEKCLNKGSSIDPRRYHYSGLLFLFACNNQCESSNSIIFKKCTDNFKCSLSYNPSNTNPSWKYLGIALITHSKFISPRLAIDIQNCFLNAITSSNNSNSIADVETGYYLALLYLSQEQDHLADELMRSMKLDYPSNCIIYISKYLIGKFEGSDESDKSQIKRLHNALLLHTNREEDLILDEGIFHNLTADMLILFANNTYRRLAEIYSELQINDKKSNKTQENSSVSFLILSALRTALDTPINKLELFKSMGSVYSQQQQRLHHQLQLLLFGVDIISSGSSTSVDHLFSRHSKLFNENEFDQNTVKYNLLYSIHSQWLDKNVDKSTKYQTIQSLLTNENIQLADIDLTNEISDETLLDKCQQMIMKAILFHLQDKKQETHSIINQLILLIPRLVDLNVCSIIDSTVALILKLSNVELANKLLQMLTNEIQVKLDSQSDKFIKLYCNLMQLCGHDNMSIVQYLVDCALKQPMVASRRLYLLEYVLSHDFDWSACYNLIQSLLICQGDMLCSDWMDLAGIINTYPQRCRGLLEHCDSLISNFGKLSANHLRRTFALAFHLSPDINSLCLILK